MRDLAPKDVYRYACEDADVTLKLKNVLEKELKENGAERLFYDIEMPLVPGIGQYRKKRSVIGYGSVETVVRSFYRTDGTHRKEIYDLAGETFNIASPKQVGEVLFDKLKIVEKAKKTKTGQYVTSEEVLESLRHKHPVVEKILEHRGLKKLLGTYIDALPPTYQSTYGKGTYLFQSDCHRYRTSQLKQSELTEYAPYATKTGKKSVKHLFRMKAAIFHFSADYSQIELRIMAHLSEDKNMIDAFLSNHDIHAATAAKIYKIGLKEVDSDMRRKAKSRQFRYYIWYIRFRTCRTDECRTKRS